MSYMKLNTQETIQRFCFPVKIWQFTCGYGVLIPHSPFSLAKQSG